MPPSLSLAISFLSLSKAHSQENTHTHTLHIIFTQESTSHTQIMFIHLLKPKGRISSGDSQHFFFVCYFNVLIAIGFSIISECLKHSFFTLGLICQATSLLPYLLICGGCCFHSLRAYNLTKNQVIDRH